MNKIKINVVMDYLIGGAFVGVKRIADAMPQYQWNFTTTVQKDADLVIYMNNHKHYLKAKEFGVKYIIQRKTGERSLKVNNPSDLDAIICASKRSFEITNHSKKILIYNGLDLDYLKTILPMPNIDLLTAESRIGVGQRIHLACEYAKKIGRQLTILGSKANLQEDTYYELRKKYPQFNWVGTVKPEEALSYIKGCLALIVSNPSHGVANQVLEAVAMDKKIINFANTEIPPKDQIDIKITIKKYDKLIKEILKVKK